MSSPLPAIWAARSAIPCGSRKPSWRPPSPAPRRASATKAAEARQLRQFATGLRKYVQENADYVGPNFAEEARKIHYGETPERHIYGEATFEEAKELAEEGVDVAALPPDPEGAN
jgi:hypothetical protein